MDTVLKLKKSNLTKCPVIINPDPRLFGDKHEA